MTDPALRPSWQAGVTGVEQLPTTPRRGRGTTNHCMHGKDVLVEEIVDWQPLDYVTLRSTMSDGFKAVSMFAFDDDAAGTVRALFAARADPALEGGSSCEPIGRHQCTPKVGFCLIRRLLPR